MKSFFAMSDMNKCSYNTYLSQIYMLNQKIIKQINNNSFPYGLDGKLGLSIYFYIMSRFMQVPYYREIADSLLQDVTNNMNEGFPMDIEHGLSGIGLGIHYILKKDFVEGDEDEVLSEIDNYIYKGVMHNNGTFTIKTMIQLLFYFCIRYESSHESVLRETIICLYNKIAQNIDEDFFNEPLSFNIFQYHLPNFLYVSGRILSLDIYNQSILLFLNLRKHPIKYTL